MLCDKFGMFERYRVTEPLRPGIIELELCHGVRQNKYAFRYAMPQNKYHKLMRCLTTLLSDDC